MFCYYHVFEYEGKKYIFDKLFFDCEEITEKQYLFLKKTGNILEKKEFHFERKKNILRVIFLFHQHILVI